MPSIKLVSAEGDAGGGGAVQLTYNGLTKKQVMDEWARFINCLLHALSKCLENGCRAIFGKQGIGQNTCLQMIYAIVTVYKRIKQEGGIALLDEIQAMAVRNLK